MSPSPSSAVPPARRWQSLILAIQFLTRLPTPQLRSFHPEWLAASARWFAPVGLLLGSLLWLAMWLGGQYDPWLAALAAHCLTKTKSMPEHRSPVKAYTAAA